MQGNPRVGGAGCGGGEGGGGGGRVVGRFLVSFVPMREKKKITMRK